MDVLKNKTYTDYDYLCRYSGVPTYYNTMDDKYQAGIVKNINKDNTWVSHKVIETDTLDSLSLTYYGNPTYWWIIAYFNDIQDAFIKLSDRYTLLKIPSFNGVEFKEGR